jgi:ribokinase
MSICVLGIFVADLCFFAEEIPISGQTILGEKYSMGPGGKGSNQAIAAARLGGKVSFITKLGQDSYADLAFKLYQESGVNTDGLTTLLGENTGVAGIMIDKKTGENAINVIPGAANTIDQNFIDANLSIIENSKIFLTQLETPINSTLYALKIAKNNGCLTILNPAPAKKIPEEYFKLIDYLTPNEAEASSYTNKEIKSKETCSEAANYFLDRGVKNIIITLGDRGCFFKNKNEEFLVSSKKFSFPVVDTTGAGDAFNGALSVSLAEGKSNLEAVKFANLAAGISVTREGATYSMPKISELEKY